MNIQSEVTHDLSLKSIFAGGRFSDVRAAIGQVPEDAWGRAEELLQGGEVTAEAVAAVEAAFLDDASQVNKAAAKAAIRAICRARVSPYDKVAMPSVLRRNSEISAWSTDKIEVAARMAFISEGVPSAPAVAVAEAVAARVHASGLPVVDIETLQDFVQEELMRSGHFKVASRYVVYRSLRAEARDEAPRVSDMQEELILVTEADGGTVLWDGSELRELVAFAMDGLDLGLSSAELEAELRRSISGTMRRKDLWTLFIINAKSLIERDSDFAKFAARVLLARIYEEVLGWKVGRDSMEKLGALHREQFLGYIQHGVEIERLSPRLLEFDVARLADSLDPAADFGFDYLGAQTLYDRYLVIDKTGKAHRRLETPQFFWMRVAMGLFIDEPGDKEAAVLRLYSLYSGRRFCSSTPTLFNSGTLHSQLSSCYLYKVDDSIESIMYRGVAENAFLSKWAGGLGGSWTAVRGTGSYIKGTNGESQGIVPFLKLHNDQLIAVNQGGKRRGSGCAYLETWHNDIEDFLQLRINTGDERRRTHDMNTANWIPDLFMKRMEARLPWTLFRSNEVPDLHELYGKAFEDQYVAYEQMARDGKIYSREIPAIDLWKTMLKALFETGHPWITFKDPCNLRSPQDHAGVIHSSNLCTEITLNTSADETAVCNLGSVVLDAHVTDDGVLDLVMLRETIQTAVRALDNVIDINFYPTEAARNSNTKHRPIGLGIMGLHDALHKKGIDFASAEAVEFNDEFMEAIAYFAYEASSDIAAEKGTYSSYEGSKWSRGILPQDTIDLLESERGVAVDVPRGGKMDWTPVREKIAKHGMRNSNVLAIAPTATISNIIGATPCIEPAYKNLYVKSNLSGDFVVLNRFLVDDLKKANLWSLEMSRLIKIHDGELDEIPNIPQAIRDKHRTVFAIDYNFIIDAAARRQKWIDQSQSVNLFLGAPSLKVLSHMYRRAWQVGLKTTYYLRSLQASNVEKSTVSDKKVLLGVVGAQSEEAKAACSIEAARNGEECEACQ